MYFKLVYISHVLLLCLLDRPVDVASSPIIRAASSKTSQPLNEMQIKDWKKVEPTTEGISDNMKAKRTINVDKAQEVAANIMQQQAGRLMNWSPFIRKPQEGIKGLENDETQKQDGSINQPFSKSDDLQGSAISKSEQFNLAPTGSLNLLEGLIETIN